MAYLGKVFRGLFCSDIPWKCVWRVILQWHILGRCLEGYFASGIYWEGVWRVILPVTYIGKVF